MKPDLSFPVFQELHDQIHNYELHHWPRGVYQTRKIFNDNYLFPLYYLKERDTYRVSTSVLALIRYKQRFVRDPRFHTTNFYRPTFLTIDQEIKRSRNFRTDTTGELKDPLKIEKLGCEIIQDYITKNEERYPGYTHVVLMGGKDSQNLVLAERKAPWVVLSGEPNAPLNREFVERNGIELEDFVATSNDTRDEFLLEEILGSDCFFDVAHIRWVPQIVELWKRYNGKIVLWIGTSGDGVFSKNHNHLAKDYYVLHDLHVGTAMGIWHQLFRNILNVPVLSPYQCPRILDEIFYRFDPYFVLKSGDIRVQMGERLYGKPVWYPEKNPTPMPWKRDRWKSIGVYVDQLKREGIPCEENLLSSFRNGGREKVLYFLNQHSAKKRTPLSRILHPIRKRLQNYIPAMQIRRRDIGAQEIK